MYYPNRDNAEDGQSSIHRAYIGWDGLVSNLAMRSHSRRIAHRLCVASCGYVANRMGDVGGGQWDESITKDAQATRPLLDNMGTNTTTG